MMKNKKKGKLGNMMFLMISPGAESQIYRLGSQQLECDSLILFMGLSKDDWDKLDEKKKEKYCNDFIGRNIVVQAISKELLIPEEEDQWENMQLLI